MAVLLYKSAVVFKSFQLAVFWYVELNSNHYLMLYNNNLKVFTVAFVKISLEIANGMFSCQLSNLTYQTNYRGYAISLFLFVKKRESFVNYLWIRKKVLPLHTKEK